MKKIFLLAVCCVILVNNVYAFSPKKKHPGMGISVSIQESHFDIMLPLFAGERTVISPVFLLSYTEDVATTYGFGVSPKFYTTSTKIKDNTIKPYVAFKLAAYLTSPNGADDSYTDILIGGAVGGEYFFTKNFSVGAEVQLNTIIPDENVSMLGAAGKLTINTGSALFATIYF